MTTYLDIKKWTEHYNSERIPGMWGTMITSTVKRLATEAPHNKISEGLVLKLKDCDLRLPPKARRILDQYSSPPPPSSPTINDPAFG